MIDVVEVSYRVVKVKQQKYVCRCGGCVETAPGPERAVPGSRYSLGFAIKVAIDKYLDHIPLARQERILRRHGLGSYVADALGSSSTRSGDGSSRSSRALLAHVLAEPVIGLDQTSWPRLDGKGDKPWQMWALTAPGVVAASHSRRQERRDVQVARRRLTKASIVCDAAQDARGRRARQRPDPARWMLGPRLRKFEEARPIIPKPSRALEWIGALYEIDERAGATSREAGGAASHRERRSARDDEDVALGASDAEVPLHRQARPHTSSRTGIGSTASCTTHASRSTTTRPSAGSAVPSSGARITTARSRRRGTEVAATFYSVLETAKLDGVDPAAYLAAAITAAERGVALMPWDFATSTKNGTP